LCGTTGINIIYIYIEVVWSHFEYHEQAGSSWLPTIVDLELCIRETFLFGIQRTSPTSLILMLAGDTLYIFITQCDCSNT
jgi:hypothetical protein